MGVAPRHLQTTPHCPHLTIPVQSSHDSSAVVPKGPFSLFLALRGLGLYPVAIESTCPLVPCVPCGVYDTTIESHVSGQGWVTLWPVNLCPLVHVLTHEPCACVSCSVSCDPVPRFPGVPMWLGSTAL